MLARATRFLLALCLVAYVNLCACPSHTLSEEAPACGHCRGHGTDSLPEHPDECTHLHGGDVAPGGSGIPLDLAKQAWLPIPFGSASGPALPDRVAAVRPFWNADPPGLSPGRALHVVHQVFLI